MSQLVSIIIPAYNAERTLERCLQSVVAQTHQPLEIIVVNDGSTDDTAAILTKWQGKIKIIQQANGGAPAARNAGWRASTGEYLLFCDADVTLSSQAIERMLSALESDPKASYAYSSFKFGWKTFTLWPFDGSKLRQMPYIHTTSLIRREAFTGFDESLQRFQDWDLWLTLLGQDCQGVWVPEILFTVSSGGTMSRWVPRVFYRLPWLPSVRRYQAAENIIRLKHKL